MKSHYCHYIDWEQRLLEHIYMSQTILRPATAKTNPTLLLLHTYQIKKK